jgi:hypothetical protein
MTSSTAAFFDELAERGHVPWLEHEHGRLLFEAVDGECVRRWTVAFDDGDVTVSQGQEVSLREPDVDAVLRADRALLDRAACGETSLIAADLRGEITYSGRIELLAQMSRLLPGPQGQRGPRFVGTAGRRSG